MRISIVVPSYNQAPFLPYTLDSIFKQDYQDIEVIVMDGGSTDGSVDVLKAYEDERLTWESKPDKGQADAINQGMRQATGDILAYLNSDDIYLENTIPRIMTLFEQSQNVDLFYGSCYEMDADGSTFYEKYIAHPVTWWSMFTKQNMPPQPAVFWRRRVLEQIGNFDINLHFRLDHDYWMRAWLAGMTFQSVEGYLSALRLHPQSKTVSQQVKFYQDWFKILDKVYSRDDLPPEALELREVAYKYAHYYAGENLYAHDQLVEARKFFRDFLSAKVQPRHIILGSLMWFDCTLNTKLVTPMVTGAYKGLKSILL